MGGPPRYDFLGGAFKQWAMAFSSRCVWPDPVCALRQVLAQQAICIFLGAELPGTIIRRECPGAGLV